MGYGRISGGDLADTFTNDLFLRRVALPLHLHRFVHDLPLEGQEHLLVRLSIEPRLVAFASDLILGTLLDRIQLLMLLQLVEGGPLLLNHVAVGEGEVVEPLHLLQVLLLIGPLLLLVLQDLIGHDERVGFVRFVLGLVLELLAHQFALEFKKALLILALLNFLQQLTVALLMDLIDELTQHVFVVRSVKIHPFREAIAHLAVNEARHEGIGHGLRCELLLRAGLFGLHEVNAGRGHVRNGGWGVNIRSHVHLVEARLELKLLVDLDL